MNMKTHGYAEYEKLCDELDRKTKEACDEFKRGIERLCNQDNPVPWDWSTTPPWINWIAMWKDGDWFMFDTEPLIKGDAWDNDGGISSHHIPKSHRPQWSGDWKLSKTMRPGYKEVK